MYNHCFKKLLMDDIIDIHDINETCDDHMQSHLLSFGNHIASAFRFRYQSEIDKKSCSSIKGEKDKSPTIKVFSATDATIQLDLITKSSSPENSYVHFNSLYEVTKPSQYASNFDNGMCFIPLKKDCNIEIKLDFLGIKRFKLKEAIPRIREINPNLSETEAKQFYMDNKESAKLRVVLFEGENVLANISSNSIKAQNAKENNFVKIQHISPKIVAANGETLIIILDKKITCKSTTYLLFDKMDPRVLYPTFSDGQTFAFPIPRYDAENPVNVTIRIETSENHDDRAVKFMQTTNDDRKRKPSVYESNSPLKKPNNYDCPRELFPESGGGNYCDIEHDGPQSMEIEESVVPEAFVLYADHTNGSESCKDSGIHSDDRLSNTSDMDSDDDTSFDESDEESDVIEVNENHTRRSSHARNSEPINFPPTKRSVDNRLSPNREDQVAKKIFSEVARIGHDYAFGKKPSDLFFRIEKQLPVVFTLQDDVGDTPLNNAILKGNVVQAESILEVVIKQCKWALDLVNTSGHTALILSPACDVPSSFITKLLDAGCRLDIWDDLEKSAIIYAIEYKNSEALVVLLDYIQKKDLRHMLLRPEKVYYSPLQVAVMNNYFDGVQMLLSLKDINGGYMVDVNELALMNDETALHIAVERECGMDVITLLLARPDININHIKDNGSTVLKTAMKMGMTELVVLLKQRGAEDIDPELKSEVQDIVEVMEDDRGDGCDACPVAEMTHGANIEELTARIGSISLKKERKTQLIKLLLNGDIYLNASELEAIFKPAFKTLLTKYDRNQQQKDFMDMVDRFNCLPNSLDQLFIKLRQLGRSDMIYKIANYFGDGLPDRRD